MNLAHKFKPNCCLLGVVLAGLIYTQPCITTVRAASIIGFGYPLTASDTIPRGKPTAPDNKPIEPAPVKQPVIAPQVVADSLPVVIDTQQRIQTDTFSFKKSRDTLEAPLKYEAADSAVVLVRSKKVILYGKTSTTYTDMTLTAPKVELDQQTQVVMAVRTLDSTGATLDAAVFKTGETEMTNDTIFYNFRTQVGVTKKTYTKQGEMLVIGEQAKKVSPTTTFIKEARFTTCMLDEPHFAFVSGKMKMINQQLAVSGPAHPEFEGVPVPIYVPFGFYPMNQGRHSGLMRPNFMNDELRGLGLQGIGYYKVINDYWDAQLTTDIFSYGEWAASARTSYRRRYRYNGGFGLDFRSSKQNFKGDPDFNKTRVFNISWTHAVDGRARPGVTFSANVNAGSTKYNRSIPGNAVLPFQNMLGSSITFSKSWKNKPYNLSLSANHNQNNNIGLINISLPNGAFTLNNIYPFERKNGAGVARWYEKLAIGYNATFSNSFSFYDTITYGRNGNKPFLQYLLDTAQWMANHSVPIVLALPPILGGRVIVSPGISYNQSWFQQVTRYGWNANRKKVDTITQKGLFIDQRASVSLGFNTALYGMYQFKRSRVIALRHIMRPQLAFSYTPDLNKNRILSTQVDTTGRVLYYNDMGGQFLYNTTSRRSGSIQFGLDNNLEMKYRSKKDTGKAAIKKVVLIDGFGFSATYDLLRDSMNLSREIPFYLRTTLFDKININASTSLNPYQTDKNGFEINRYAWQGERFKLGRITSGNIAIGTNFQSKPKDTKKEEARKKQMEERLNDPLLQGDQQRLLDYMQQNPNEFVDFNIQWQLNLSYSLSFFSRLRPDFSGYEKEFQSGVNLAGSFNLTPKWKLSGSASIDMTRGDVQYLTMSINRDLHCWQLAINVIPVGFTRSFNFTISPKASLLQDLRINRTRFFSGF